MQVREFKSNVEYEERSCANFMQKIKLFAVTGCLLCILCACANEEKSNTKQETIQTMSSEQTRHWSYEAETGPTNWGELENAYKVCKFGNEQSPINIVDSQVETNDIAIEPQYNATKLSLENNGHTIQANVALQNNLLIVNEQQFNLLQFHFHTPSEHQFNGQLYEMELHFVHQNEKDELAVLGVMIQQGEENKTLQPLWNVLPQTTTDEEMVVLQNIALHELLPPEQSFYYYEGSLTTPPCTEQVQWFMLKEPIEMSNDQIAVFQQIFTDNHRPVQPLNDRTMSEN